MQHGWEVVMRRRDDEDGDVSEVRMLLVEIQVDVDRLNALAASDPQTPVKVAQGVAMLADKIDALVDIARN